MWKLEKKRILRQSGKDRGIYNKSAADKEYSEPQDENEITIRKLRKSKILAAEEIKNFYRDQDVSGDSEDEDDEIFV